MKGLAWADMTPGSVLRGIQAVGMLLSTGHLYFSREVQRKGGLEGIDWQRVAAFERFGTGRASL